MENESELEVWPVWIDRERRIISFQEAEGFERLEYPTHDEMFRFVTDRIMEGYAIQEGGKNETVYQRKSVFLG